MEAALGNKSFPGPLWQTGARVSQGLDLREPIGSHPGSWELPGAAAGPQWELWWSALTWLSFSPGQIELCVQGAGLGGGSRAVIFLPSSM